MNEQLRESLSALMDDSANELELERILKNVDNDELRGTWVRYHAARSALSGQSLQHMQLDISASVREAVLKESAPSEPTVSRLQQWMKPVASLAVAASVTAVVVVGGLQFGASPDSTPPQQVANSAVVPLGMATQAGALPVGATFGTQALPAPQQDIRAVYRELARQQMQQYLPRHVENAALNTPQGIVPYARVDNTERPERRQP